MTNSYQNTQGITHYPQQKNLQIQQNPKLLKPTSEFCPTRGMKNPINWSNLIRNYISQGSPREALLVHTQIRHKGIYILGVVPLILKVCPFLSNLNFGKSLHAESIKAGADMDVMIGTSLLGMYAKCSDIVSARKLFDYMPERNVVTWNAMLGGYLGNGDSKAASVLFEKMSTRSEVTWIEMINGFARTGDTVTARCLFNRVPAQLKNVVTWTVMVDGYASNGEMEAAMKVFEEMPQRNFYAWSSIISGYIKQGDVKEARVIFDQIPVRNLVNWNSLISGYAQNGCCEEALEAFGKMQAEGFEPDEVTFASVISACAQLGLLDAGKEIHNTMNNKGIGLNQFVLNALVDMYAKCGDLVNARLIFEGMPCRNSACWNSMISGFAIHGHSKDALELFCRMEDSDEKPDGITFLSVLSACAHGGFVDEGLEIFSKIELYGLAASMKHYGCLVDLLGRAGRLKDAYDFIKRMPMKPNYAVWGALLGACRIHLDIDLAEQVMRVIDTVDSSMDDYSHCVLLSNIYAASDKWEKAEKMRMVMVDKGFQKTTGCSSVMVSNTDRQLHTIDI